MIRQTLLSIAVLLGLVAATAQAAEVPHYVNFQSVLRDDSGNILADDFIDLQIKLLDQDKDVVYEETQPGVQIVRGAINVMIGEGIEPGSSPSKPTGGIPTDAVNPELGAHFLQIQFGSNLPSEPMELGSVPYAMYAEVALGLAPNIPASAIPGNFATDEELAAALLAHENDTTAHPAGSITTVDEFDYSNGTNVQDVLDDLDAAIKAEENARITEDSGKVNRTGDTMTGLLNFDAGSGETARIEANTGNISTPGTISANGGTMTGSLNMSGNNITNVGSGSGVGFTIADHENRITALEGAPSAALAKAWVKFHTDGSHNATIDGASFNVASVTYSGTDDGGWRITFATPFSNANYVMAGSGGGGPGSAMMLSCDSPTSTASTAYVVGTDKNGNSQTGNARSYNLVFFGN